MKQVQFWPEQHRADLLVPDSAFDYPVSSDKRTVNSASSIGFQVLTTRRYACGMRSSSSFSSRLHEERSNLSSLTLFSSFPSRCSSTTVAVRDRFSALDCRTLSLLNVPGEGCTSACRPRRRECSSRTSPSRRGRGYRTARGKCRPDHGAIEETAGTSTLEVSSIPAEILLALLKYCVHN